MYDSVIKVAQVSRSVGDGYSPIKFTDLSTKEREIFRTVTEEGGYGTCDPSEVFHQLVNRVQDHGQRQEETMHVYLERNAAYYRLYVEVEDQVFAY